MPQTAKYMYISFITDFAFENYSGPAKAKLIVEKGIAEFYCTF